MILAIIITATLCLASCEPPEEYYPGTLTITPEEIDQCHEIDSASSGDASDSYIAGICFHGYASFKYPSKMRPHDTVTALKEEFGDWIGLLTFRRGSPLCSETLRLFLCYSYFPLCYPLTDSDVFVVYPCQELCELVTFECKAVFEEIGFNWPRWIENYNCSSLSSYCTGNDDCVAQNTTECPATLAPTTDSPTSRPTTDSPSSRPTTNTDSPSSRPTTDSPSGRPTTDSPTSRPTDSPSGRPTTDSPPTDSPSGRPTTDSPTGRPTTDSPTSRPSCDQNGDSNETKEKCDPEESSTNSTIREIKPIKPSCISCENDICSSSFGGYNSTSPSLFRSSDLTNSSDYDREFADFHSIILSDTPCSEYIKTFFCFTYFPYCQIVNNVPRSIYPCSEVCESVLGANSACREEILDLMERRTRVRQLPPWLQSYDCNTLNSNLSNNGSCAPGPDPPCPTVTPSIATEPPCTCCNATPCIDISCKYRKNANGGTFKRNDYTIAARVVFLDSLDGTDCKSFYVRVVHQYREVGNPTDGTLAPAMGDHATIYTNIPDGCTKCDSELDIEYGRDDNDNDPENSYFIAGYYNECNGSCFKLLAHDSLVAPWQPKYGKKMRKWIADGNAFRRMG